jgi:hypothetical protein
MSSKKFSAENLRIPDSKSKEESNDLNVDLVREKMVHLWEVKP